MPQATWVEQGWDPLSCWSDRTPGELEKQFLGESEEAMKSCLCVCIRRGSRDRGS